MNSPPLTQSRPPLPCNIALHAVIMPSPTMTIHRMGGTKCSPAFGPAQSTQSAMETIADAPEAEHQRENIMRDGYMRPKNLYETVRH